MASPSITEATTVTSTSASASTSQHSPHSHSTPKTHKSRRSSGNGNGRERIKSRRSNQKDREAAIQNRINRITSEAHLYNVNASGSDMSIAFSSSNDSGLSLEDRSRATSAMTGLSYGTSSRSMMGMGRTPQVVMEEFEVSFAFGLLTSVEGVPLEGNYGYNDMFGIPEEIDTDESSASSHQGQNGQNGYNGHQGHVSSNLTSGESFPILEEIMVNATNVCKNALVHQRNGNEIIMCHPEKLAYVTCVKLDETYQRPPNRNSTRSYITASVPIVIKGTGFSESSRVIAKIVVRQALIEALKMKQLYADAR